MSDLSKFALLEAIDQTSGRGLLHASKWLSELLVSKEWLEKDDDETGHSAATSGKSQSYILAKSFFDCKEYTRCAVSLLKCSDLDERSQFLRLYAQYLAGELEKEEMSETILGPKDGTITNPAIVAILNSLDELIAVNEADTYLLYLHGMLKHRIKDDNSAKESLIQSINLEPRNWAAWQELSALMTDTASTNKTLSRLPDHAFARIFHVSTLLDLHLSGDEISKELNELEALFPRNLYLKTLRAILAYNAQDFEAAETTFEEVLKQDPHRMDSIDIYSNVLFVLERRAKLGHLAKMVSQTDKFRPETCCVVGNYFSLMSDHEKAVSYFRRALKLNRFYLAAWTLMGHEYVELKNTHAAIESYRRAVDINQKDYRAWYGLGQAYEMLEMHYYALHYFQRAAALKPLDVRMWTAVGNCHEKLGRLGDAIKAYKRALLGDGELDVATLLKIGELYERSGDTEAAKKHFQICVEASKHDPTLDVSSAMAWLERYKLVG